MVRLKNIIDTWNMVFKYKLDGATVESSDPMVVLIPESEYERLLASVKNKRYIENLKATSGWFCGGRATLC